MKSKLHSFLIIVFAIVFVSEVDAQSGYSKPRLSSKDSWSIIMLPDPQCYSKFARNQPIFDLMTAWIADNIDTLNVKMVVVTGDLVEQNELLNPAGANGDQTSAAQWQAVSKAFSKLDGKVPYAVCAGNHDFGYSNISLRRHSHLKEYFYPDRNFLNKKAIREVGINAEGEPTLENAAYEFSAPSGKKFLVLSLEFAPRDTVLAWAKTVTSKPVYKEHTVIVLTHSYVNAKNQHIVKENYTVDGNYGAAVFKKLVQPSNNINMVLSGHICEENKPEEHVGFRTDTNAAGKKIQQMAFNAQALGGGWHGNGGDGWLRILEFLPDGKTVNVKTFSPFFAFSPTTQQFAWGTGAFREFSFQLD